MARGGQDPQQGIASLLGSARNYATRFVHPTPCTNYLDSPRLELNSSGRTATVSVGLNYLHTLAREVETQESVLPEFSSFYYPEPDLSDADLKQALLYFDRVALLSLPTLPPKPRVLPRF